MIQAQVQQGLISDCKIQDLRDIELVAAKILENDVPVLVLSFRTQEIIVFRNARTGEIAYGKEVRNDKAWQQVILHVNRIWSNKSRMLVY